MTQQFHEGQEVEVWIAIIASQGVWRKAKILYPGGDKYVGEWWYVQYPDGTRGVFDVEHIRTVAQNDSYGQSEADRAFERWNQP
jgi:hypothetical protein